MRYDIRYSRVRSLITAPEIPRTADGEGVRLCHHCQRFAMFRGGFLKLLLFDLMMAVSSPQGIEARSDETPLGGSAVGESPVPTGCAQ